MKIEELLQKKLPEMPSEIETALGKNQITLTRFEDKNEILTNRQLQQEVGYGFFEDGSALVSMVCPMQGVTAEMIRWWFWWHPQADERYQAWFPGAHISIGYAKKDAAYFEQETLPEFQPNDQYPREKIGPGSLPLVIKFKRPEDMGFEESLLKENGFPVIVCGSVGLRNLMMHTEMTHLYQQTEDGLFLISRFWMGTKIKSRFLRKKIITEEMVRGMAEHCCIEYRNLAEILPGLYQEYGNTTL